MQLKGRVARFSKSAASGVAITKIGMIAFSSATRADSGRDPKQDDVLYLEIPNPDGDLESIVEAVTWACDQGTLEAALLSFTKVGLQNTSEYAGAADGGVATPAFDGRPTRRATYGSGAALPHRRIQ
jgi:hypothetical protein